MILYLGKIQGLLIHNNIEELSICTHLEYFDDFLKEVHIYIGDLSFRKLRQSPAVVFIREEDPVIGNNPDTPEIILYERKELRNAHSYYNGVFKMGLWLLKDSSVHLPLMYKFKQQSHDKYYHESKNTPTCADGRTKIMEFTVEEIKNATELLTELNKLSEGIDPDLFTIENDFVPASSSLVSHNSIEKIDRGRHFVWCARHTSNILEKISWYIVALEALYNFDDKDKLKFNLSNRVPRFISNDEEELKELSNIVRDGYTLRSNFLHGGKVEKANLKSREKHIEISTKLDDILRRTFHEIIKSEEKCMVLTNKKLFKNFFQN